MIPVRHELLRTSKGVAFRDTLEVNANAPDEKCTFVRGVYFHPTPVPRRQEAPPPFTQHGPSSLGRNRQTYQRIKMARHHCGAGP